MPIVESFPTGHLGCNCTVVGDPASRRGVVIDPGGDLEAILACVRDHALTIDRVYHTHAHLDHMLASHALHGATHAELFVHKADRFLWNGYLRQCERLGIDGGEAPKAHGWIRDGADLECCGGTAMHTPGHTPGSVSFYFESAELLVAGDTLFQRGIGRTDLVGGSFEQIERSVRGKLFALADDTRVITGHGPETSIGYERDANPFFGVTSGTRLG
tara:strand:- start:16 stop:663 length:648 start_codon:yes stop_codon:yes gene_type:complete